MISFFVGIVLIVAGWILGFKNSSQKAPTKSLERSSFSLAVQPFLGYWYYIYFAGCQQNHHNV